MLTTCNIVIVGGEGDLAFRKLYPALYALHRDDLLADCTQVIGFGRGKYEREAFIDTMLQWTKDSEYVDGVDEQCWERFSKRVIHFNGDATSPDDLSRLKKELGDDDIVFYLSTPPTIFAPICEAMREAGVVTPSTRLVVEKPLGSSLESFGEINDTLFKTFDEHQIYRIDHYLGKETVQNLLAPALCQYFL